MPAGVTTQIHRFSLDNARRDDLPRQRRPSPASRSTSSRCPSTRACCASPPRTRRRGSSGDEPVAELRHDARPRDGARARSARSAASARASGSSPCASSATTGYVVTFRQVDPLYTVDLSDPAEPARARRAEDPRLLLLPAPDRGRPADRRRQRARRRRAAVRAAAVGVRRLQPRRPEARAAGRRSAAAPPRSSTTTTPSCGGSRATSPCCRSRRYGGGGGEPATGDVLLAAPRTARARPPAASRSRPGGITEAFTHRPRDRHRAPLARSSATGSSRCPTPASSAATWTTSPTAATSPSRCALSEQGGREGRTMTGTSAPPEKRQQRGESPTARAPRQEQLTPTCRRPRAACPPAKRGRPFADGRPMPRRRSGRSVVAMVGATDARACFEEPSPAGFDPADLAALAEAVDATLAADGVTFGGAAPFRVDPVPRVIAAAEWEPLAAGPVPARQGARPLRGRRLRAPAHRARGRHPARPRSRRREYFEPLMQQAVHDERRFITIAGLDLRARARRRLPRARGQRPHAVGHRLRARRARGGHRARRRAGRPASRSSRRSTRSATRCAPRRPAGVDDPVVVGPHRRARATSPTTTTATIAERLGAAARPAGRPAPARGRLCARTDGGDVRVDVVYRRTDEDRLSHPRGGLTDVAQLLLEPWCAATARPRQRVRHRRRRRQAAARPRRGR